MSSSISSSRSPGAAALALCATLAALAALVAGCDEQPWLEHPAAPAAEEARSAVTSTRAASSGARDVGPSADALSTPLAVEAHDAAGASGRDAAAASAGATSTPLASDAGDAADGDASSRLDAASTALAPSPAKPRPEPPRFLAVADTATVAEDRSITTAVLANDRLDGQKVKLTLEGAPKNGRARLEKDQSITFEPAPDFHGRASYGYRIRDAKGRTSTAAVSIVVTSVDDVPVAVADTATIAEDASATTDVLANDRGLGDGPVRVVIARAWPRGKTVVNADKTITFTPETDFQGLASYEYRIIDADGESSTAVVSVRVRSTDDKPTARVDTATVAEDGTVTAAVLANDRGLGDGPIEVEILSAPEGSLAVVNEDNTISFTPPPDFHGDAVVEYQVTDVDGESSMSRLRVHILGEDDKPIAVSDTATVAEDHAVITHVLDNDRGLGDTPLTVTVTQGSNKGQAVVNPDNSITFTPNRDFAGRASYVYEVADADGETATASVTVVVKNVDDPPVAVDDRAHVESGGSVSIAILANDTDADDDDLDIACMTHAAHGVVTLEHGGTVRYEPSAGYTGEDHFTYTVTDGHGSSALGHVSLVVHPKPVAAPIGGRRLVLLPPENLSGAAAPLDRLLGAVSHALVARGVAVMSGETVEPFLARHRVRWSGGVDGDVARAAREELGADGVLVMSLLVRRTSAPVKLSMALRLVTTTAEPKVTWMNVSAHSGDEHPGLLALGLIEELATLETMVSDELAETLAANLAGRPATTLCESEGRFSPQTTAMSSAFAPHARPLSVAVLPFVNYTHDRNAGLAVSLEMIRQLTAVSTFRVLDPGVPRTELLKYRVTMQRGIGLDQARLMRLLVDADLLVTGTVFEYDDYTGSPALPAASFTATIFDQRTARIVWQASSHHRGDDGVVFFDAGTVNTVSDLVCRMTTRALVSVRDTNDARAVDNPIHPAEGHDVDRDLAHFSAETCEDTASTP